MASLSNIVNLVDEKLSMQLDSVSWNKSVDVLAIGAYMIDPTDSSKRIGKIFLIQLNFEPRKVSDSSEEDGKLDFCVIQEIDLDGVLDLRWEPKNYERLAVATSSSLELYTLQNKDEGRPLVLSNRLHLDSMALYTQWMDLDKLVFSDSLGVVNIADIEDEKLKISSSKKIHDNLTWVVQCSTVSNLFFAGSDEGKFTGFLLDDMEDEEKHYTKKFEVGVTSIIFLEEKVLGVGSYDDTLRIFTIDSTSPIMLSLKRKIEFGGAVWRTISFLPEEENSVCHYIVAACARNGIHIISLNRTSWTWEKLASCMQHEGFLAYGLDVKTEAQGDSLTFTIASCYFDNHQLHMWKSVVPKLNI